MDKTILDHLPEFYKKFYKICLESGIDLDKLDYGKIKNQNREKRKEKVQKNREGGYL